SGTFDNYMILSEGQVVYGVRRGSDVQRGGMYLELSRSDMPPQSPLAEIFYSDIDGSMTFSPLRTDPIPASIVKRFLECAERDLRPIEKENEIEQSGPDNPRPCGTFGMSPADSASRAGAMPKASGGI